MSTSVPPPLNINVSTVNGWRGTTFADLLILGVGVYATGAVAMFLFDLAHNDWQLDATLSQWYHIVFWPFTIILRHLAYSYIKGTFKALSRDIPSECSTAQRVIMNKTMPGLGQIYCDTIQQLNRVKQQVQSYRADPAEIQAVVQARLEGLC
jgi:hypothetical protein